MSITDMSKGTWVVFDGIEGCGKTTAIEILRAELESRGLTVAVTRSIGSGAVGAVLRPLVCENLLTPLTRAIVAATCILDAHATTMSLLKQVDVVLTDRYINTFYVYHIYTNRDPFSNQLYNEILTSDALRVPDASVIIKTSVSTTEKFMQDREDLSAMDSLGTNHAKTLDSGFTLLSKANPSILVVENNAGLDEFKNQLLQLPIIKNGATA